MKELPAISASNKIKYPVLYLLFSGVLLFFSIAMIAGKLVQLPFLAIFFGIYLGLLGIAMIVWFLTRDTLYIFSDRLQVVSIFGKTKKIIYFNEIISWAELLKHSRSGKSWHVLIVYTENNAYKISEAGRRKYYAAIKTALTANKPRDVEKEKAIRRKGAAYYGSFFIALFLVFFYFTFVNYRSRNVVLTPSEITTIKGVITNNVTIHNGSKGGKSILILLDTYPGFVFSINENNAYRATHTMDYVKYVRPYDTLSLDIKTDDYLVKLTKQKPPGFWEKALPSTRISIYGLRDKNNSYLAVSDYNREKLGDRAPYVIPGLLGFFALIAAGICWVVIQKNKESIK